MGAAAGWISADLGASWQPVTTPATMRLYQTWGTVGDLYVVAHNTDGTYGVLHSTDGVTWQPQSVPIDYPIGLWGSSGSDIYTVGNGGIAHSTGDGVWTVQDTADIDLVAVWGSSGSDVYAVGASGVVHSDGTGTWTLQPGCPGGLSVWGASASDVWAGGGGGTICHSTGDGTWTQVDDGTGADLYGIFGTATETYAVGGIDEGQEGILLRNP